MNVLLVDDEKAFLVSLKKYVLKTCGEKNIDINITATADPYCVLENEQYKHYDVILIDIDMPAVSGIEITQKINSLKGMSTKPFIIFVTNRDGLVFEALRTQPYSFVRKSHLGDLTPCLESIYSKLSREDSIYIKSGSRTDRLEIKEVIYIEKEKNYIIFHTQRGEYKERSTIDARAVNLMNRNFLRPHIGYLVNVRFIDELLPDSIRLINGIVIPVTKKYRKEIKQRFYEWVVKIR